MKFAVAGTVIEINEHYLLPGAEHQFTFAERNGHGRTNQSGTQVSKSVAVSPGSIVVIDLVRRRYPLENLLQVGQHPGFVLYGSDASGGAWQDNTANSFSQAACRKDVPEFGGDVVDVTEPLGA